jgi:hypothetical protein
VLCEMKYGLAAHAVAATIAGTLLLGHQARNVVRPPSSSGCSKEPFALCVLHSSSFCYEHHVTPRRYSAAATDCRNSYGTGLELPAILAVSLMSATILGFSRAAAIASRLFHWP